MSDSDPAAVRQARERIARLITAPDESRSLLPAVVGLLDHEDRHLRLSAACGICLAGTAQPDLIEYLVRRLLDRIHEDDERAEAILAFEYLATQFPTRVDEVLQAIREDSDREPLAYSRSGGFPRSDVYAPSRGASGVGRTRTVGTGDSAGPGQIVGEDPDDEPPDPIEQSPDDDGESADEDDGDGAGGPGAITGRALLGETISEIVAESRFDDVSILTGHDPYHFGESYRAMGSAGGREYAIGLRLFDTPTEPRPAFASGLADALSAWQSIDGEGVVQLYDWGQSPQPWAAVEHVDARLSGRDTLSIERALWTAVRLTRTVVRLHNAGVVHGGLEPRAVAYTETSVDDDRRRVPLLDNAGLMRPFRFAFDPATRLDPRYAAPEYFDRSFGPVDAATDVYQLGGVCYHLFAGRAPFEESSGIGQRVLDGSFEPPSAHRDDVPAAVDEAVTKAMATQKITRYETAARMEQDLLAAGAEVSDDG